MRLNKPMLFLVALIAAAALSARPAAAPSGKAKPAKPAKSDATVLDVNQIECFIQNNGKIGEEPTSGADGFFYPKGQRNTSIIFTGGIWVIGQVEGDVRTACADYSTEFQPGMILPSGAADDPTKEEYRIYKYNKGETVDAAAIAQGAPSEVVGDQMVFCVFNDMMDHTQVFTKPPIGIEAKLTAFGFNQAGAMGNTLFYKFTFTNKSAKTLEQAYSAVFFDPDNGDGNDDYVACDTTLGIGFVYNGDNFDQKYGAKVPAMGCDFFQGPIVDAPGESATLPDGTVLPDKKILKMTSFFSYINGSPITGMSDPTLQSAEGAQEAYFFVQGKRGNGEPWITPAGVETKFPFSGDPVLGSGWLMSAITPPKDMRMGLSAGPFTLEPNDPKDVVIGLVVGQGDDNLKSISIMKYYDKLAQAAYDLNFQLASPAPQPVVQVAQTDEDVMLYWDTAAAEYEDKGYSFEGYNVYQGESAAGPWRLVKAIDKTNLTTTIWDDNYNEALGTVLNMPVQFGEDGGLRFNFHVEKDYINNSPLVNGKAYYFAVTTYSYNPDGVPKTLENTKAAVTCIPQRPVAQIEYQSAIGDTIGAVVNGITDGYPVVTVMDPAALTGHAYTVSFFTEADTNSAHFGKLGWRLTDSTTGEVKLDKQFRQASSNGDEQWAVVDGLKVKVFGAPFTFKNFQVVANGNGPLDVPEMGAFAFNANGFPFLLGYDGQPVGDHVDRPTTAQQAGDGEWGIGTGMNAPDMSAGFTQFISRVTNAGARWPLIIPNDFEIRFTAAGGKAYIPLAYGTGAMAGGTLIDVPFELWNVGPGRDTADDVRLFPYILDDDNNGQFNLLSELTTAAAGDWSYGIADHTVSGGNNDPQTDWFYWMIPEDETPGQAGYDALVAKIQAEGDAYEFTGGTHGDVLRRMVLVNWNGGDCATGAYDQMMPETGTIFRIVSTKPNNESVTYTFSTADYAKKSSSEIAKAKIEQVNVFPNPYFGHNQAEGSFFTQFVTFNNLPEECTIRVFSLSGQLVRTLVHDSGTPFERWNLLNEDQLPVASGMYVVHIEAEGIGEKILKLGVVNREQRYLHM